MGNYVVDGRADLPLGTTEAAVRSCVSVIAAVTSQCEEILAYWLDLYYQVRRAYEIEQNREPDPRLIAREDLYPVLREMMKDALKSTAREKAAERIAGKKAVPAPAESVGPETAAEEKPGGWTVKKSRIRDRLIKARDDGVTFAQIESAGGCTTAQIIGILNAGKYEMKVYRCVEAALDALGK